MKITPLDEILPYDTKRATNGGEIDIHTYRFEDIVLTGESLHYPNTLFMNWNDGMIIRPHMEEIMSLKNVSKERDIHTFDGLVMKGFKEITHPVFFFIYNTDNYYHFMYDSVPYLITYLKLKKTIPGLKLLVFHPNQNRTEPFEFVSDLFALLGITRDDLLLAKEDTRYSSVYVSSSYTHHTTPSSAVFDFYENMVRYVRNTHKNKKNWAKHVYVSRRSSMRGGDNSNVGTDYTERRVMVNEDRLVEALEAKGFVEVFTEKMSLVDKIMLFSEAEWVVGAIGGGLFNVMFSPSHCRLSCIVSPTFLEVNGRFTHCFRNVHTRLIHDTEHVERTRYKTNMRVSIPSKNIVGEITDVRETGVFVSYTTIPVAGWSSEVKTKNLFFENVECIELDKGLNSPYKVDIHEIIRQF